VSRGSSGREPTRKEGDEHEEPGQRAALRGYVDDLDQRERAILRNSRSRWRSSIIAIPTGVRWGRGSVTSGGPAARSAARSRAAGASASVATRISGASIPPNGMSSTPLQITTPIATRSPNTRVFPIPCSRSARFQPPYCFIIASDLCRVVDQCPTSRLSLLLWAPIREAPGKKLARSEGFSPSKCDRD